MPRRAPGASEHSGCGLAEVPLSRTHLHDVAVTAHVLRTQQRTHLGGKTSMQWVTAVTNCLDTEAASGQVH